MKYNKLIIAATFVSAFALIATSPANAEDETFYYDNNGQIIYQQTDSQYQIPPSYQGEYYPQEAQPSASYYGNQRNSQNNVSNDIRDNPNGYYNYYY